MSRKDQKQKAKGKSQSPASAAPTTLTLLLEIGCEEIPARFLAGAQRQLGEQLRSLLLQNRLLAGPDGHLIDSKDEAGTVVVETFSTPRRLVAYVPTVLNRQAAKVERVEGPPVRIGVDAQGRFTRAAEAFAAKNGATVSDLKRVTTPKGEYLAIQTREPGMPTLRWLSDHLDLLPLSLSFQKSMFWLPAAPGTPPGNRFTFVRPIRWALALLGEGKNARTPPGNIYGVRSTNSTRGHRLDGGRPIRVGSFRDYREKLRAAHVEIDPAERHEIVRRELKASLEASNLHAVADPWLEEWVVNSTEWPTAVVGEFEAKFLKLPREILITVMRDHQKYFAVENAKGNLEPRFIAFLNREGDPKGLIRAGHERVLRARFTDAEFFWETDLRSELNERVGRLAGITYHVKLGTYADKVDRMEALACIICDELERLGKLQPQAREKVMRAVRLCKCDLTTQMVREFPELQGVAGGLYARHQQVPETDEVADAIYDHYLPASFEDRCPRTAIGAVVALADKLDSIVAGFGAGLEPTGSSDPFALRRAGNGVVRLAIEKLPGLDLTFVMNRFFYPGQAASGANAALTSEVNRGDDIDKFLRDRMESYFREVVGLRYDTARAVLPYTKDAVRSLVPSAALARAEALERVRDTDDFVALSAAAKRTRNIRKSARGGDIVYGRPDQGLFTDEAEKELYRAYEIMEKSVVQLGEIGKYDEAFRLMATIRPAVDRFFDKVFVMTDDERIRKNRLLLLLRLNEDVFTSLADLAEIAIEGKQRPSTENGGAPKAP